jgi:hypothetical protein
MIKVPKTLGIIVTRAFHSFNAGSPAARKASLFCIIAISLLLGGGMVMNAQAKKAPCTVPPMGWNSYDCYNFNVTEKQFMENAHYLANLKKYGWEYCIVDFIWWIPYVAKSPYDCNQYGNWNKGNIDQYGRFMPDTSRFPSAKGGKGFKALCDSVHNLGLKFGLHLMRGVPRMAARSKLPIYGYPGHTCADAVDTTSKCAWMDWMWGAKNDSAGQKYITSMISLCNDWGVDYVKVDDLSAGQYGYHGPEVIMYGKAIAEQPREIVFSTSPGATPLNQAANVSQWANMWRLVNDFWDVDYSGNKNWNDLINAYNVSESWRGTSLKWGEGFWPDVDMLPFGHLALCGPVWNPRYSLSTLSKGEHRLILLLWCINNGPLMYGGNMPDNKNDPFYDSLMTNTDALFVNKHGIKARVLKSQSTGTPIWTSTHPLDTTTKFVLFSNTSGSQQTLSINLTSIGFAANQAVPVKNIWNGANLNTATGTFTQTIPSHDAYLYALGNAPLVWPTTNSLPPRSIEKQVNTSSRNVFFTTSDRFVIPAPFAGKTVKVSAFDLGGRLQNAIITREHSVHLYKDGSMQVSRVAFVKVTEVR